MTSEVDILLIAFPGVTILQPEANLGIFHKVGEA